MNTVNLMGRIEGEPIVKGDGKVKFRISCPKTYLDNDGNKAKTFDLITCVAFGQTARAIMKQVHEGERWFTSGRWAVMSYDNPDGVKIITNELIVALMAKPLDIEPKSI